MRTRRVGRGALLALVAVMTGATMTLAASGIPDDRSAGPLTYAIIGDTFHYERRTFSNQPGFDPSICPPA